MCKSSVYNELDWNFRCVAVGCSLRMLKENCNCSDCDMWMRIESDPELSEVADLRQFVFDVDSNHGDDVEGAVLVLRDYIREHFNALRKWDEFVPSQRVAKELGIATSTLAKYRAEGKGPRGWIRLNPTQVVISRRSLESFKSAMRRRAE